MNLLHTLGNDFTFSKAQREIFKQYITDYTTELKGGVIPLDLTREKVIELVKTYGPIIYIHGQASIFPFNIEENWQHYNYERRGNDNYMTEKDPISSASGTLDWYFKSKH